MTPARTDASGCVGTNAPTKRIQHTDIEQDMRPLRQDEIEPAAESTADSIRVVPIPPRLRLIKGKRTTDSDDLLERLERLNEVGVALSRENDIDRLLETILVAAQTTTNADGGTIYRVTEERTLRFEMMRTDSLDIAMGGATGSEVPFGPLQLYDGEGQPIHSNVVAYAYHHDTSLNITDAYTEEGFDFSGTREFDRKTGYRSKSFLTVPMKNHQNEIIGVLQLLNATEPGNRVASLGFSSEDQQLAESLASQAAIALTNRLLITHLENLFESFIDLVNGAIDDKSPYTGAHIAIAYRC